MCLASFRCPIPLYLGGQFALKSGVYSYILSGNKSPFAHGVVDLEKIKVISKNNSGSSKLPEQGSRCGFKTDHCFEAMRRFKGTRVGCPSFTLGQEMCKPRDDNDGRDAKRLSHVAGLRKAGIRGAESSQFRVRTHEGATHRPAGAPRRAASPD